MQAAQALGGRGGGVVLGKFWRGLRVPRRSSLEVGVGGCLGHGDLRAHSEGGSVQGEGTSRESGRPSGSWAYFGIWGVLRAQGALRMKGDVSIYLVEDLEVKGIFS